MPPNTAFTTNVDTRSALAKTIKDSPTLLALFKTHGGTEADLDAIIQLGKAASAFNQLQGTRRAGAGALTASVALRWATLQEDYKILMGILDAVLADIRDGPVDLDNLDTPRVLSPAEQALVTEITAILKDETPVTVVEVDRVDKDGNPLKETRKVKSVPNVRAEIENDAARVLALTGIHAALAARGFGKQRLNTLKADAVSLTAALADKTVARAGAKNATASESAAVVRMRRKWASVYRILGRAALKNQELADLLKGAARTKKAKKAEK